MSNGARLRPAHAVVRDRTRRAGRRAGRRKRRRRGGRPVELEEDLVRGELVPHLEALARPDPQPPQPRHAHVPAPPLRPSTPRVTCHIPLPARVLSKIRTAPPRYGVRAEAHRG
eukprot:3045002-Rhodomonas_salina.2